MNMAIHPDFADWYRTAAVTVPEGLLPKRWAGIETILKKPTAQLIAALARTYVVGDAAGAFVPEGFREAFKAQDESFPTRDNFPELRVLAGAVLRQVIESNNRLSVFAALAITCGAFGARSTGIPERSHLEAAERFLVAHASALRRTSAQSTAQTAPISKKRVVELLPDALFAQNAIANMKDQFQNAFVEIGTALTRTQEVVDALSHTVRVREEELNVLWWVQNAVSRHLNRSFKEIGPAAGSIIFAVELAELTTFVPGPIAMSAVLIHSLGLSGLSSSSERSALGASTNATPRDWRESIARNIDLKGLELLCPVFFAIDRSLTTNGPTEWFPVYQKVCDIDLEESIPITALSIQSYRERMLVSSYSEAAK
jgi:hypothetical protein